MMFFMGHKNQLYLCYSVIPNKISAAYLSFQHKVNKQYHHYTLGNDY